MFWSFVVSVVGSRKPSEALGSPRKPSEALALWQAVLEEHVEDVVVGKSLPVDETGGHVGNGTHLLAVGHHDHAVAALLVILQVAVPPVAVHHAAVVHLHHAAARALHHHAPRAHLPDGHHLPVGSHHLPGLHHVPLRHLTVTLPVGRHHLRRAHPGAAVDHPHLDRLRRAAVQHGRIHRAGANHDGTVGSLSHGGGSNPPAGPVLKVHGAVERDRGHEPGSSRGRAAAAVHALQALEVQPVLLQVARHVLASQALDAHEVEDALGHSLVDAELVDRGDELLVQLRAPNHPRLLQRAAVVLVLIPAAAILVLILAADVLVLAAPLLALGAAAAAARAAGVHTVEVLY